MRKSLVLAFVLTSATAFAKSDGYSADGKVKYVDDDEIVLQREGLPDIELDVRSSTSIERDGKQAKLHELNEGDEVRAKFQVYGDDVVALEIEAKPGR